MLFNPHSQIQEEPATHHSQTHLHPNSSLTRNPYSNSPNASHLNNGMPEEWLGTTPIEEIKSDDISKVCVSYDIYGNELSTEDGTSPNLYEGKNMNLESIEEEEAMSPDAVAINQENSDPVLHLITPIKKRNDGSFGERTIERRRASFAITRNPLLDITPAIRKRKASHHIESTIERALLNNTTPKNESNDVSFTKKLR